MLMQPVVYKNSSYTNKVDSREGYKIFVSPQTGQEIQIPVSLFELSSKVKAHYESGEVKEIPHYEYKASVFKAAELKSENPKANLQESDKTNNKVNPKSDFQGNPKLNQNPNPKLNFKKNQQFK